uniref:Uncharacterized protein n=1 Tax=Rhizophora mucronata TaxID=61149 RepID=A0A2P2PMT7_RHIMU
MAGKMDASQCQHYPFLNRQFYFHQGLLVSLIMQRLNFKRCIRATGLEETLQIVQLWLKNSGGRLWTLQL